MKLFFNVFIKESFSWGDYYGPIMAMTNKKLFVHSLVNIAQNLSWECNTWTHYICIQLYVIFSSKVNLNPFFPSKCSGTFSPLVAETTRTVAKVRFHNDKKLELSHRVVWAYILFMNKICSIIKKISWPNFRNVLKAILGLTCIT